MLNTFLSNRICELRGITGKPVRGYDIRLVDEAGAVVTQGEMGELQVRGPTVAIMSGRMDSFRRQIHPGQGWLLFVLRAPRRHDEVGGVYAAPFEVEGVLMRHPDVLEAAGLAGCVFRDGDQRFQTMVITDSR
jgi:benzoate-CoA ligase